MRPHGLGIIVTLRSLFLPLALGMPTAFVGSRFLLAAWFPWFIEPLFILLGPRHAYAGTVDGQRQPFPHAPTRLGQTVASSSAGAPISGEQLGRVTDQSGGQGLIGSYSHGIAAEQLGDRGDGILGRFHQPGL